MCCLFLCFCFVFFPVGVVLAKLFISNKACLVAKVGSRLPGSRKHLGASGSWCSVTLGIPPSLHLLYQHPAGCDANRDVKEGEPSALGSDFFDQYFNHKKMYKGNVQHRIRHVKLFLFIFFLSKMDKFFVLMIQQIFSNFIYSFELNAVTKNVLFQAGYIILLVTQNNNAQSDQAKYLVM